MWRDQRQRPEPAPPVDHQTRQRTIAHGVGRTGLADGPLAVRIQVGQTLVARAEQSPGDPRRAQESDRGDGPAVSGGLVALAHRQGQTGRLGLGHGRGASLRQTDWKLTSAKKRP